MDEKKLQYLTNLGKVALFYFLGLSLFFIAGFVIITFRVRVKKEVVVPAVVGHMFLEEFNRLSNLGLRINLEPHHSTQYPYGFILAQSLPAGQIVKENTKITLLVNLSEKVVSVPKLVGNSIEFVDNILNNITGAGKTYRLTRGITLFVPSEKPNGEVLEQFPLPETMVVPNSPVHLLVSEGSQKISRLTTKTMPFNLAARMAYELKKPLSLSLENTQNIENDGFVSVEIQENKILGKLAHFSLKNKKKSLLEEKELPYRFHWQKLKLSTKEKNFTLRQNLDYSEQYSIWYLESPKVPIPVFVRQKEKLEIFRGFWDGKTNQSPEKILTVKAGEI